MGPGETEPISVFGGQFLKSYGTQDGKIILEDYTRFTIVEKDGSHWHTERISWDGFDEVKIEGDVISGLSYRPTDGYSSWHSFSYHIYSRVRTGGAYP